MKNMSTLGLTVDEFEPFAGEKGPIIKTFVKF